MKVGTPGFVGARLREGREARGLTALSLAELVGVSRAALSQYEIGPQTPRPDVMDRIAAQLNLPVEFFCQPVEKEVERRIFWRSMSAATKGARTKAYRRYLWLRHITDYLQRFVVLPPVNFPQFELPDDPVKLSMNDIEQIAREVRSFWKLGIGPISDVVLLLENNGAIVARGALGADTLDAFSEWDEAENRPYIFLGSDKDSAVRSRFDVVHELAHLILHRKVERNLLAHPAQFKLIEEQAHRFAAAFLVPATTFASELNYISLDHFRVLKRRWKVAISMMLMRCQHLGFLELEESRRLWMNLSRRGWKRREPLDDELVPEQPRVIESAISSLLQAGVISREQLKGDLPYAVSDIEELLMLPRGYLSDHKAEVVILGEQRNAAPASGNATTPGDAVVIGFPKGTGEK
jgi:Zn-dependent peptidase ImmA (M78 family)/DNA-binding XRE family transcriptional regulator